MRTMTLALIALLAAGCEDLPIELPTNNDDSVTSDTGMQEAIDVMLPVNDVTIGASYLYCMTGDRAAMMDLLVQQITFTDLIVSSARDTAQAILENGFCQQQLADVDEQFPEFRNQLRQELIDNGFDPRNPISEQTEPETHASIFGKIWDWIKDKLGGGGGGGGGGGTTKHITIIIEEGAEVNAPINICVETTNPSDPSPFYPDPPPER